MGPKAPRQRLRPCLKAPLDRITACGRMDTGLKEPRVVARKSRAGIGQDKHPSWAAPAAESRSGQRSTGKPILSVQPLPLWLLGEEPDPAADRVAA